MTCVQISVFWHYGGGQASRRADGLPTARRSMRPIPPVALPSLPLVLGWHDTGRGGARHLDLAFRAEEYGLLGGPRDAQGQVPRS